MKLRGIGWAVALSGIVWLGVPNQAEGGGVSCDTEICPDDVRVCVSEEGEGSIYDFETGCIYTGKGKVRENENLGIQIIRVKGFSETYGCEESARAKVRYDPESGQCVKKSKVRVGAEKRALDLPAPCDCDT